MHQTIVTVVGSATDRVRSNELTLGYRALKRDKSLQVVTSKARQMASAFTRAAEEIKLPSDSVFLEQMVQSEDWDYSGGKSVKRGYVAEVRVDVILRAAGQKGDNNPFADRLNALMKSAEELGIQTRAVSWGVAAETAQKLSNSLKERAAASARLSAEALARGAKCKLGRVLAINPPKGFLVGGIAHNDQGAQPQMAMRRFKASSASAAEIKEEEDESVSYSLDVPDHNISEHVTIYFELA